MQLPRLNKKQEELHQYHQDDQPTTLNTKKIFLILGGVGIILISLLLLFGGSPPKGQPQMKKSLQATTDALGIADEYLKDLNYPPAKNDVAQIQIILRGNRQVLNDLYKKTFKQKKSFGGSAKPDKNSIDSLDTAKKNNTLDSEIFDVLKPKIIVAKKQLMLARTGFSKNDSIKKINNAIDDLNSIEDILDRPR